MFNQNLKKNHPSANATKSPDDGIQEGNVQVLTTTQDLSVEGDPKKENLQSCNENITESPKVGLQGRQGADRSRSLPKMKLAKAEKINVHGF